ncbi:MAG TPA: enoyl-CoA hydratase/isomerase family protein [Paracoccus sp.]|nr:enoyl-CoA hydratase/isomerase family protein [Paracoccus sp. (in: a-proteobacteria)]
MGQVHLDIDGAVAVITLDNPAHHNAVDAPMRDGLARAYDQIEADDALRVAIIRGAGTGSFCAGGSIDGYLEAGVFGPGAAHLPRIPRPSASRKPYIAAMCGHALGGGFSLALTCDIRVAGRGASMGPTGLKMGAVQGAETITRLTRLIGQSRATDVLLQSRRLSGEEAGAIGLVQHVIDDDAVMQTARHIAGRIAGFSPWTVQMTKELVSRTLDLTLEASIAREDAVASEGYGRPDALEGFRAFKEKRKPRF